MTRSSKRKAEPSVNEDDVHSDPDHSEDEQHSQGDVAASTDNSCSDRDSSSEDDTEEEDDGDRGASHRRKSRRGHAASRQPASKRAAAAPSRKRIKLAPIPPNSNFNADHPLFNLPDDILKKMLGSSPYQLRGLRASCHSGALLVGGQILSCTWQP